MKIQIDDNILAYVDWYYEGVATQCRCKLVLNNSHEEGWEFFGNAKRYVKDLPDKDKARKLTLQRCFNNLREDSLFCKVNPTIKLKELKGKVWNAYLNRV